MLTEDVGLGEADIEALAVLAVADRDLAGFAPSQQIVVADIDFADPAVLIAIAPGNPEIAGILLLDFDIEDDAIRRRTGLLLDLHGLEVTEFLQPRFRRLDLRAIIGIAL